MLKIIISPEAELQLDAIYENNGIYDGRNFTQAFINWNREFHCYVNAKTMLINEFHLKSIVRDVLRRYLQS